MTAQQRYGGSAYGGATRARESRPGGAILVPGFDAAYYLFVTGGGARYGGAAYGGRRQLTRPAAGIAALPDPAAGAVTLQWWWGFGDAVTVFRIDPDGSRVPVRGAEGVTPVGPSRLNPSSNPRARDGVEGYAAAANTTLSQRTGLTPGEVRGVTTAVRGTATAAGQAGIVASLDAASPLLSTYGFEVQTSAVAATLGLSIEWFDASSASLGSTFYPLPAADRTRAAAGLAWVTPTTDTFPSGAAIGVPTYVATGLPAGGWVQVTARISEAGSALTGPYFDGDSLGGGWIGAPGLSFSRLGQQNLVVDAEAPLDVPIVYEMTCASVPGWLVRSEPVTLPSAGVFSSSGRWGSRRRALLTHPGQARTVRVWIEDAPSLDSDIEEGQFKVKGRRRKVVVQAAERDGYESSLSIYTEDGEELERLLDMFAVPSPMLLRLPGNLVGYPPVWWVSFGKLSIEPLERSGLIPVRKITVPITEVDRPSVAAGAIAI